MSLTRKFLKALGIEEDKIEEIITAHGETVAGLKDEITKAQQGADDLAAITKERDTLKQRVDALEKSSGDAAKIQADFDAYKKQVETEKANTGKKALVKKALEAAGANPAAIDLMLGTVDLEKVELNGDALKDAEAVLKPIKEAHGGLFGEVKPNGTPPINPPGGTKKDPKEMNFNEYKEWRKANP